MPKVLIEGNYVDVPATALFSDDGQTPLHIPTGPVFTAEDIENARRQEKDKLYGKIDTLTETITSLNEQVGGLTAEQQRQKAAAEEERQRLEAEARRQEEQGLDPTALVERKSQEWQQQLDQVNKTWEQRFQESEAQRQQAEALAVKEREFANLREYTLGQIRANESKIAPQFLPFIEGSSQEEIDAKIAQAISATDDIAQEMQQAVGGQHPGGYQNDFAVVPGAQPTPPVLPGTRATGGPANSDPAAANQQLTPDQIAAMPMDQYAKLRGQIGIGGQSRNRGLFG